MTYNSETQSDWDKWTFAFTAILCIAVGSWILYKKLRSDTYLVGHYEVKCSTVTYGNEFCEDFKATWTFYPDGTYKNSLDSQSMSTHLESFGKWSTSGSKLKLEIHEKDSSGIERTTAIQEYQYELLPGPPRVGNKTSWWIYRLRQVSSRIVDSNGYYKIASTDELSAEPLTIVRINEIE